MTAPIQKAAKAAFKTFSRYTAGKGNVSQENLLQLTSTINQITANDVGLNEKMIYKPNTETPSPVTYIHIWEDGILSMGIFVVRQGARLPLHNHPGMYGVIKTIHGRLKIESFTKVLFPKQLPTQLEDKLSPWQQTRITSVVAHPDKVVTPTDECCVLVPHDENYHEIKAVDGPAAFLDILSPPYEYERKSRICHYFEEIPLQDAQDHSSENLKWLIEISEPEDYKCDLATYEGPPIRTVL